MEGTAKFRHRIKQLANVWVVVVFMMGLMPAHPAAAGVGSYASYNGGTFIRIPDGLPFMTKQETCVFCVASGTQAWIDYARLASGTNNRPTQSDMWWWYSFARGAWGAPYNTALETRCQYPWPAYTYNRRAANISLDDGVDPYGVAWAMKGNTPNAYHINVYSTGRTTNGFDYASHGAAWTLANYQEPVGVVIGNGGHFVLITYVDSDVSPLSNFWTPINFFRYRDPFVSPGAGPDYVSNRVQIYYVDWQNSFTEYGWSGHSFVPAPNCDTANPDAINANCRDEARGGPWVNNLWWGKWVTIERDVTFQNDPDWVWRNSR